MLAADRQHRIDVQTTYLAERVRNADTIDVTPVIFKHRAGGIMRNHTMPPLVSAFGATAKPLPAIQIVLHGSGAIVASPLVAARAFRPVLRHIPRHADCMEVYSGAHVFEGLKDSALDRPLAKIGVVDCAVVLAARLVFMVTLPHEIQGELSHIQSCRPQVRPAHSCRHARHRANRHAGPGRAPQGFGSPLSFRRAAGDVHHVCTQHVDGIGINTSVPIPAQIACTWWGGTLSDVMEN